MSYSTDPTPWSSSLWLKLIGEPKKPQWRPRVSSTGRVGSPSALLCD